MLEINDAYLACGIQRPGPLVEVCSIYEASDSVLRSSSTSVKMTEWMQLRPLLFHGLH